MRKSEYGNIYQQEERHFYYVSLHDLLLALVRKYGKRGGHILDAGCGTGGLMKKLSKNGYSVMGVDISQEAIKLTKTREMAATIGSVEKMDFANESFDGVISVDVLYHMWVGDVKTSLVELNRVLRPKGWMILKLPANNWVRTDHDETVMTARRFSKSGLIESLRDAGFEIKYISYIHIPLLLASILGTIFKKRREGTGVRDLPRLVNGLLKLYFEIEAWLIARGVIFPFGNGLVAVAVKQDRK